jgi:hypothetical protein
MHKRMFPRLQRFVGVGARAIGLGAGLQDFFSTAAQCGSPLAAQRAIFGATATHNSEFAWFCSNLPCPLTHARIQLLDA